jgi:hypothetical protein
MSIAPWTTVPAVVWLTHHEGFDPRVPSGATVLSADDAAAWLAAPAPCDAVRMLRARGATVATPPDAPAPIRTLARRLRARLAVSSTAALADVADDLGAPVLATALRRWPPGVAVTFADLASAAAGPPGRLDDVARLLLALEHL